MTLKAKTATKIGIFIGEMSGPGSGAWTWLFTILEQLSHVENLDVVVFTRVEWSTYLQEIPGIRIEVTKRQNLISRLLLTSRQVRRMVKMAHLDAAHFCTLPLPKRLDCTVVYTLHDLRSHYPPELGGGSWRDIPRKIALSRVKNKVDAVITPSEWAKNDVFRKLQVPLEKISVIPMLSIKTSDRNIGENTKIENGEPYVLALGHLEVRKNLGLLVRATQSVYWPKGVSLRIVGKDVDQRQNLESIYKEKMGAEIFFQSEVSETEKWQLIDGAAVIALPSYIEGFGILTLEGISAGVPVLVSDQSALPEVVRVEESILSVDDADQWAKAIGTMCTNTEIRQTVMLEQRKQLKRFQDPAIIRRLVEVYLGKPI